MDAKVPGGVTPLQECVVKVSGVVPGKYDGATDKQNGLKLTSSGKPAASGLAGAYFMNAIKTSTTAASGAASTSAVASAALFASVLLALLN